MNKGGKLVLLVSNWQNKEGGEQREQMLERVPVNLAEGVVASRGFEAVRTYLGIRGRVGDVGNGRERGRS